MAVRKRLVDLTLNELKAVLKKKGLSEIGERDELLMRLRQAMGENRTKATHPSVTTDASGTQDKKTASSNDERNTSGMMEKEEEMDLEVLLEEIEGRGRGIVNDGREGVSNTRGGGSDENRGEGKESESGEKLIGKETPMPIATLWISGLPSTAKATDLKQLFSQHGQVNGAKVVASSKSESKRFGIVTMSTAEEAQACIKNANNTEFLDNLITVEFDPKQRVVGESPQPPVAETDSKQDDLASSASLWISGLTMTTKAADLKEICMKHGEVVHAKVVASAKNPDSKCYYGIVTMSTKEEADCCIEKLNQTEVNGQVITLEKRKQDSVSKTKPSSRPESTSSSSFYRKPFERGRFSGSRGFGFRGRSFSPRPFMGRGRGDSGYRGRGRDNFMYMDQLRADYEREMFHEQRMREGGDRRDYMPEFPRGGRGRFPGRSRPPFERPWNDRRGGFRRGMNDEPYWGQAAKRPRMDDDQRTGDARQFGDSGNRFPAERAGSGGGNWNNSNQGDKDQAPREPFNAASQDKGFGSTNKSNWPAPDANSNKKGNAGGGYNQWQSGGADGTSNRSGAYQSGSVMYSDYSATQSYPSGMDTSAGGSYQGAGSSSYAATTGTTGSNLYGNTGSSYSGKESGSYAGPATSVYSSAGGGSYGGAGSTSYAAAGSGSYPATGGSSSYPATGSSSYPAGGSSYGGATGSSYGGATGSSYGGATGGSYGGATGGSYGASASSSYPPTGTDAYGAMNSSYGGTDTSSYAAPGSSSYGTAYAAPVSTTYSSASVSYQGTDSYGAQQGATSMYASDAAYAGHAGSSTGVANSQAQYDSYKPQQGSSQAYSWY